MAPASRIASAQDTSRASVPCAGQRVDSVSVSSNAPSVTGLRAVPVIGRIARETHVTTRETVVRRFLLLGVGDRCNELRRAESERILRAQPFLADASIVVYPTATGGVELDVRTIDEASLIAGARGKAGAPPLSMLRLGTTNLNGSAILFVGDWRDGGAYRDEVGLHVTDRQFAGEPLVLDGEARARSLGRAVSLEVLRPFYTDFQHVAWRGGGGVDDDYVHFDSAGITHALRLDRTFLGLGGLFRVGPPGQLWLFGGSITAARNRPAVDPVLITRDGLRADTMPELQGRYAEHRVARLNALLGVRDIRYFQVRGVDALRGIQDFPIGFQVGTELGRSVRVLGRGDDDVFTAADVYVGIGVPTRAVRVQLRAEGRHGAGASAWEDVLTTGRAEQFTKLSNDDVLVVSGEVSGGWRQRVPFRLTLADVVGGLRGFGRATAPGGRRVVMRIEERSYRGAPLNIGDVGIAMFADAGRMWAGDVPFGVDQNIRAAVGVGLLAAVPARSTRLWRVDLAIPVTRGAGRSLELRFSSADHTAFYWPEPHDVERTRDRTVPRSVFAWP